MSDLLITPHFTWKEALWLPQWEVEHIPTPQQRSNILLLAQKMELVREFVGLPIIVLSWIRPVLNHPGHPMHGKDYNALIKIQNGATPEEARKSKSVHKTGEAVDWTCRKWKMNDLRAILAPKLEEFGLCMERNPDGTWIHQDIRSPRNGRRYFNP